MGAVGWQGLGPPVDLGHGHAPDPQRPRGQGRPQGSDHLGRVAPVGQGADDRRPVRNPLAGNAALWFNEDVFEFVGGNGGSIWDKDGMPLVSDEMAAVLEYYKKIQDVLPPGWLADGYVETMNTMALRKAASARLWGRSIGYLTQYAPADKQNPETYKMIQMPLGPKGSPGDPVDGRHDGHPQERAAPRGRGRVPERGRVQAREHPRLLPHRPVHLNPPIKGVDDDPPTRRTRSSRSGAAGSICRTRTWRQVRAATLPAPGVGQEDPVGDGRRERHHGRDGDRRGLQGDVPADAMKAGQEKATSIVQNAKNSIKKA